MKTTVISDFDLVTLLMCEGIVYSSLNPTSPRKAEFVFHETKRLKQISNLFWSGQARVEPRAYTTARKTVRAHFDNFMQNHLNQQL